jgi:predicted Zn-dependent peptidase
MVWRVAPRGAAGVFALAVLALGGAWFGAPRAAAASPHASTPAPASAAQEIVLPAIRDVTLPNGARLLLAERHDVPLVSFTAYVRGGSITDPPGKEGLASLTGAMLRKGAGRRDARALADAVDGVGAILRTGGSTEACWASGEFLARDRALMVELLRAVLREPAFADSELTKLRARTVDALRAEKEDPGDVFRLYGAAYFYGAHPYGRPEDGDEATVAALTRDDVLRCYRDHFGGDRLTMAVVGDFQAAAMERELRAAFADWAPAAGAIPALEAPRRVEGRRVLLVDAPDATQTYFVLANAGIARTDPDRDALEVANTAFGGRFTSMINTALRIRSGLTYGASCRVSALSRGGAISIGSYTKTESTQRALDLALETLRTFRASGLDAATISSARHYINGQFPTDLETSSQLAGRLAADAFYGLGREEISGFPGRIAAVDSAAVRRVVARVYPDPGDLAIVLVGNAAKLRAMARRYGPVTEIALSTPLVESLRRAREGGGRSAR